MNSIFFLGVTGGTLLVLGSLLPEKLHISPYRSVKNWLFALGNFCMLLFSLLDYLFQSGMFFFVLLQGVVNLSSIFMMFRVPEKISAFSLLAAGVVCTMWSLFLEQDSTVLLFIIGLIMVSLGFVFAEGSMRRNEALFFGSACIAIFSYINETWIFFWLNSFFALFSLLHVFQIFRKKQKKWIVIQKKS